MPGPEGLGIAGLDYLRLEGAAPQRLRMGVSRRLGGDRSALLRHDDSERVDRARSLSYLTFVAPLDIITLPDRKLRLVSDPIERIDDDLRRFADQMLETMYDAPGIGLAAIQVGVPRRMIVLDVAQREDEAAERDPMVMINPEILTRSDELAVREEGCLSIPEYYAEVERPATLRVRFLDRAGKPQEIDAGGVLATCIQHEIDHLDGKLFIDYLSKLKRDMVIRKFTKQAKLAPKPASL